MTNTDIKSNQSKGFTLIELLVSLTILSVLMTLLFSGFKFTQRVEERVDNGLYKISDLTMAQTFIRKIIGQTEAVSFRDDNGEIIHAFYGDAKELRLIAPLGNGNKRNGLQRIILHFDEVAGVKKLVADVRRYQLWSDWESYESQDSVVLVEGFENEGFAYLDGEAARGGVWRNSWQNKEMIPSAIKITLDYAENELVKWPDLIVATRVGEYQAVRVLR